MSATEVLRRMLDERRVEWGNIRNDGSESDYLTEWQFENNQGKAIAIEWAVGSGLSVEIHRYHLTPEQAIAATLGPGTCRLIDTQFPTGDDSYFKACSGCGFWIYNRYSWENTRFCPHCGRKVVDE